MPDIGDAHSFIKECEAIAVKYGYDQVYIVAGKSVDDNHSDFIAQSNCLSDGMTQCLKDSVKSMEREINNFKDNG